MSTQVKECAKNKMAQMQASITLSSIHNSIKDVKFNKDSRPFIILNFPKNKTKAILYEHFVGIQEWVEEKQDYLFIAVGWSPDHDICYGNLEIIDIRFLDSDDYKIFEQVIDNFIRITSSNKAFSRNIEEKVDVPTIVDEIVKIWKATVEKKDEIIH